MMAGEVLGRTTGSAGRMQQLCMGLGMLRVGAGKMLRCCPLRIWGYAALTVALLAGGPAEAEVQELIHISFHSASAMYERINDAFAEDYRLRTGQEVRIVQLQDTDDHIVSAVGDGSVAADIVTVSSSVECDELAAAGMLDPGWRNLMPNNSSPFSTALVLLVRQGNPFAIQDWDDIIDAEVQVVSASPLLSGFARYGYYNVFVYAHLKYHGDLTQVLAYIHAFNQKIAHLTSSSKQARELFLAGQGDILPIWESDALQLQRTVPEQSRTFDLIYPSVNVLCRPRIVAVADNARVHAVSDVAEQYIKFVYSDQGQELAAAYGLRPSKPSVVKRHSADYVCIRQIDMSQFGTLGDFKKDHFRPGGYYEQFIRPPQQGAGQSMDSNHAQGRGSN